VFGVALLATSHLPNWQDLAAIAAFSPVIYWAVHSTLPHQRIGAAVADVETEAFVELENHSSETAPRAAATYGLRDGAGGRRACLVSSR
jgi:hypothetical protein